MRRRVLALAVALALGAGLYAQTAAKKTVKLSGYLLDAMCATGHDADDLVEEVRQHAVSCALMESCVKSGFVVVVPEEAKVYKLDEKSRKMTVQVLKNTRVRQGMYVEVEGTLEGDTVRVERIVEAADKTAM
ncbi:MAG TPA: hypothetical protein VEQ42_09070 [Pyrinomonadaceae bacterium]|nr:hypothetical protein [Pyrinomonadaceae bacterium]